MSSWFRKKNFSEVQTTHPPWQVGQHVSYFNGRDGGKWLAVKIQVDGQTEEGIWILRADFKTASGECTIWLHADHPDDAKSFPGLGLGLLGPKEVRQYIPADQMDFSDDPSNATAMAFNLLMVRQDSQAIATLQAPPRDVHYPCDIDKVHRYTVEFGKFLKHHDLNSRVYVTGVACLSTETKRDKKENPFIATAFGHYRQADATTVSYDDFVDFSHPKRIEHGSFSLTYPATWFLCPQETGDNRGMEEQDYMVLSGGDTCSCLLDVWIRRGSPDLIAAEHSEALARLSSPQEEGQMIPEPTENKLKGAKADYFVAKVDEHAIYTLSHNALVLDTTCDRVANIHLVG
ncbi:MAG: hypothetical protein ACW97O_16405, partial [Candidatus Thorarchaeota archaeon]